MNGHGISRQRTAVRRPRAGGDDAGAYVREQRFATCGWRGPAVEERGLRPVAGRCGVPGHTRRRVRDADLRGDGGRSAQPRRRLPRTRGRAATRRLLRLPRARETVHRPHAGERPHDVDAEDETTEYSGALRRRGRGHVCGRSSSRRRRPTTADGGGSGLFAVFLVRRSRQSVVSRSRRGEYRSASGQSAASPSRRGVRRPPSV